VQTNQDGQTTLNPLDLEMRTMKKNKKKKQQKVFGSFLGLTE
jgi:hypothetical protein